MNLNELDEQTRIKIIESTMFTLGELSELFGAPKEVIERIVSRPKKKDCIPCGGFIAQFPLFDKEGVLKIAETLRNRGWTFEPRK